MDLDLEHNEWRLNFGSSGLGTLHLPIPIPKLYTCALRKPLSPNAVEALAPTPTKAHTRVITHFYSSLLSSYAYEMEVNLKRTFLPFQPCLAMFTNSNEVLQLLILSCK